MLKHILNNPNVEIYVGDCRGVVPTIKQQYNMIFADPPFNWGRNYDLWDDSISRNDYLKFTNEWIDVCEQALLPGGAFWVNIPDDSAAEVVIALKSKGLIMRNWCIWHYRFGQNTNTKFINSKVHALYFVKPGAKHTWNVNDILVDSDRATVYNDERSLNKKDGMPSGKRTPLDVWYGDGFARIQGNNKERRRGHDNQLPEAYLKRVILACTNENDTILDPFLGSGTTGVIARSEKRNFVGVEYSEALAASAFQRIQNGPIVR